MFPFRGPLKKAPRERVDLISAYGFADEEAYQAETQRAAQPSPAISAYSSASSGAMYYNQHDEEHNAVATHDERSMFESTYSFVSPSECVTASAEGSEAGSSVGSGKRFRFPKMKISLTASPPKPKPKKQPRTPGSAQVSFGRGGAGNSFRASPNTSPTTPTATKRHKSSNSDPERFSTYTDYTDTTLDSLSDADICIPSRPHVTHRASRWSLEPLRDEGLAGRTSLESEWTENGGFERPQYATPLGASPSTRFGGMRALAMTPPDISPGIGRSRREEQRREARDYLGPPTLFAGPRPASVLTELGGFSHTSGDPRMMHPLSPSDLYQPDEPFAFAIPSHQLKIPPPSYDEATDRVAPMYGQSDRRDLDESHYYPSRAAYDAPPHQGLHQPARPLPSIPRRYDGHTTPMEPVHTDHPRSGEGPLHRPSMKKLPVASSGASESTKERSNSRLATAQYAKKSVYNQDPASSEPLHTGEYHLEDRQQPDPQAPDEHLEENEITPHRLSGGSQQRSSTPTVDPMRDHTSQTEPDYTPTVSRAASPPLQPTTMQGNSDSIEGSQEEQPKALSKMERALLRQAMLGLKGDNPQLQRS